MNRPDALAGFLDKWRLRWPEWPVAETFVPLAQREVAVAWFALLQEFEDAMNIAGDPLPADAKLAWWGQELRDWSNRRSRHPLGRVLEPRAAPWSALADALPTLIDARARPADETAAFATWQPLAQAQAAVEEALFRPAQASPFVAPPVEPARIDAIAAQWLAARWMAAGESATPVAWPTGMTSAWSECLFRRWPQGRVAAPVPGRLHSALARSRLQRFGGAQSGVRPMSALATLWLSWRAARG